MGKCDSNEFPIFTMEGLQVGVIGKLQIIPAVS